MNSLTKRKPAKSMLCKRYRQAAAASLFAAGIALSVHVHAEQHGEGLRQVTVDQDGTVHIPALVVPPSVYMSEQAKKAYADLRLHWPRDVQFSNDIAQTRKAMDDHWLRRYLERAKAVYAVAVEEKIIAGVRTDVVTPQGGVGAANEDRVLINLHGGGFFLGAGTLQKIEAIPIAATAKIKVISIDFRQAPEYRFPAASEDVAAVYKELLKQYASQNIGIYGTSTGGTLAAMVLPWFEKERLPRPGAVGIFSAPDGPSVSGGDLLYLATPLNALWGSRAVAPSPYKQAYASAYFAEADLKDPLVSPLLFRGVLAKFPPTLIITGTRDRFASGLIHGYRQLLNAGAEAQLEVWEGMWHGSNLDVDLPESKQMYEVAAKFFTAHLGKH